MPKTLVVVESPAKAKTIEKYLGGDFAVRASVGHIRDLSREYDGLGVDVANDFSPHFVVTEDSERNVAELRKVFRGSDGVVLATDFDREGEAIAFDVAEVLGVRPDEARRVTFTEITRDAIIDAFERPRQIDMQLVDAQRARRILDKLVGFGISPILWRKVRPGLSAGRVQSPALRLIVEREREIAAFVPAEYWSVDVRLTPDLDGDAEAAAFVARLVEVPEGKLAAAPDKKGVLLGSEGDAATHVDNLRRASYTVRAVEKKERKRSPAPPFTTSTLQQESARKLGFGARRTMQLAQRLYEGIDLPGEGTVGLITYMRTDSVNIADSALREIAELVRNDFGDAYTLKEPRRYKTRSRNAQEAHEAIRPTSVLRTPQRVAAALDRDQLRLYTLIWQRTVATQMAEARFDRVGVDIDADVAPEGQADASAGRLRYGLRATGQTLVFDGFIRVYKEGRDEGPDEDAEAQLPHLTAEQLLRLLGVQPEQHFTQPPPRYTEASLVKALEELGIGRPSTYASIISTLRDRGYVRVEDKRFYPEHVGEVVADGLVEHFPDIVDVHFTARLEEELDEIAEGQMGRVQVLRAFYGPFEEALGRANEKWERYVAETGEECPKCGEEGRTPPGRLQKRLGRYGFFVGCSRFADEDGGCKYIRNLDGSERPEPELLDETCPECGRQLQRRFGRYGPFVGCSGYPDCTYIKKDPPVTLGIACPQCRQGEIVEKKTRFGVFYGCDRYPECDFAVGNPPEKDHPCPECGSLLVRRPKSLRCWNCGAELDLDFNVTKSGDPEAEAEARRKKAEARAARAAAKAAAKKKTTTRTKKKKATGRKKTTARTKTTARKDANDPAAGGSEPADDEPGPSAEPTPAVAASPDR
ncbi:MAG TPA: type I DNA topoisomerase [Actinomycetota bacterium]|nr:type I DNA topoisomerase [Actinomycetota bacterium]